MGKAATDRPVPRGTTVFLFQGQGGFHPAALKSEFETNAGVRPLFQLVQHLCGTEFGTDFHASLSLGDREKPPFSCEQLGIYLGGFLWGRSLIERGITPHIMLGHSFGEFASLAVGGAVSFADGAQLVCERIKALQGLEQAGRMAAVSMGAEQLEHHLRDLQDHDLEIAVINHPEQAVVSGSEQDLARLDEKLRLEQRAMHRLKSQYPFHCTKLLPAVPIFRERASRIRYADATYPIYFPSESCVQSPGFDIAGALSRHLTTPFDFASAVQNLYALGYRTFYECGGGTLLRNLVRRTLREHSDISLHGALEMSPFSQATSIRTSTPDAQIPADKMEPVAIVGYGCVLPGALDSDEYWMNILEGRCTISRCDAVDPFFLEDLYNEEAVTVDKTYSPLAGYVDETLLDQRFASIGIKASRQYSKIQKMIAVASTEAFERYGVSDNFGKVACFYGATPDGIREYDESLVLKHFREGIEKLPEASSSSKERLELLQRRFGGGTGNPESFSPAQTYKVVFNDLFRAETKTILVDSACSSSLYATDLAVKSLMTGQTDLALCGGAFAASAGNSALFAQFRGLATSAVRALDDNAEGTVFSDGAVTLLLRRMSDAVNAGHHIYGVIRAIGLSSDGKSPGVNVPTVTGQHLAIERAYSGSSVDRQSIQYIEAHATATAGDVVEFKSLTRAFSTRKPDLEKIRLGAGKSLIGHTGWASGGSAIVKMLYALKNQIMPGQTALHRINSRFQIESSPFQVTTTHESWPANTAGQPRRCAINSFGFGGTNAHVVIEEYCPASIASVPRDQHAGADHQDVVICAIRTIFPFGDSITDNLDSHFLRFKAQALKIPAGKLLLPDVAEQMSRSQYLSLMGCEDALSMLKGKGVDPERISVILSHNDKCDRACVTNLFIYEDRLRRLLREISATAGPDAWLESATDRFFTTLRKTHLPSGPYTLPGIMPSIVSGRVAQLNDLKGPNFIVGESSARSADSLEIAGLYVRFGNADVVVCGGMSLGKHFAELGEHHDSEVAEGIVVFAVATKKIAEKYDLPIIAPLRQIHSGSAHRSMDLAA
ncbi:MULTISPECIES: type I polyketide synthase [Hydrocarboniphaga]|nr:MULTISPECIES: type I polyketide synthase [Hydrocarboniphaga]MDZ4079994.1 type I polyketide synthase [Hydrocarboniphaga sp.]